MGLETCVRPTDFINLNSVFGQAKVTSGKLTPVSSGCEAIAVVPVYREFEGGRIVALLEELEAQNIGSNRFEVILVVNNPTYRVVLNGAEDNQKLLAYFEERKQRGYFPNMHILNCTKGEIQAGHMGLVRGFGQLVAEDRLDKTKKGDQGVIVQLDADVSVDQNFFSKLLGAYEDPDVYSAMIGRIPLPIDFISDDSYATYASLFADAVALAISGVSGFTGDGPTLSFRAFIHKQHLNREYIGASYSEDFVLCRSLVKAKQMYLLVEPRVYKGDRVRPDGFDSTRRDEWTWSARSCSYNTSAALLRHAFGNNPIYPESFDLMHQVEFWQSVTSQLTAVDPETAMRLQVCLNREEELARRSLDWNGLNPQLRTKGLYLYGFSRLAMGENQKLKLPDRNFNMHDYASL